MKSRTKKLLALLLAAILVLSIAVVFTACGNKTPDPDNPNNPNNPTNPTDPTISTSVDKINAKDDLDYVASAYNITDGHVFDVITPDRLRLIIGQDKQKANFYDGKSIIVFADANSEVSQKAIPEINKLAKKKGVKKIYYFDLLIAGVEGTNLWDNPEEYWPDIEVNGQNGTVKVEQSFVKAKADLTTTTSLKDVPADFTAATDTFLFINNATTDEGVGSTEITKSVLIKSADDLKSSDVELLLSDVIEDGKYVGTDVTDYDYFNSSLWLGSNASKANSANTQVFGEFTSLGAYKDNFNLRSVTYYELLQLLDSDVEHNIFILGSWCSDSQWAFPFIVEQSSKSYNEGKPAYVFDFKLLNYIDFAGSQYRNGSSINADEGSSSYGVTRVGYLNDILLKKIGNFKTASAPTLANFTKDGVLKQNGEMGTVEYEKRTIANMAAPFAFTFKKGEGATNEWIHEIAEGESVYNGNTTTYNEGYTLYNELSSGYFTTTQKALVRYELAKFFGYKEQTYIPTAKIISAGKDDNGCGDDNDALDDLDHSVNKSLIYNHGTTAYDVSNYAIDITLQEGRTAKETSFLGDTTITATAQEELVGELSFDFRRQEVSEVTLTVGDNTYKTADKSLTVERNNDDDKDVQKLILKFDGTISSGTTFTANVKYSTYTVDYSVEELSSPEGFFVHTDGKGYTAIGEPFGSTYWFPNNNTPADAATYTITLNAPAEYTAISAGKKSGNPTNNGDGTYKTKWVIEKAVPTYETFATFSKNVYEYTQSATRNGTIGYKTLSGNIVPIYIYVNIDLYKNNRAAFDKYIGSLPKYLKTLEGLFGEYPAESLGFVFEDVGDGHGGSATWGAVETYARPFYTSDTVINENTFVHELTHQWFGDSVRLGDWNSLWLNEGFATYATDLYFETVLGSDVFTADEKANEFYTKNTASIVWNVAPADVKKETNLWGGAASAYNRGALALATLAKGIGQDNLIELLASWADAYADEAKTTADFIAFVKAYDDYSAEDIDSWSNAWLYGATKPAAYSFTGK